MNTENLNEIQYTGMTYNTVISQIKEIIRENPNWKENWTTFYESESGTLLIELMAWLLDNLTIRQDMLYNEMFLTTAQDDKNKVRLLNQIGCSSDLATSSIVPVTATIENMAGSGEVILTNVTMTNDTNGDVEIDFSNILGFSAFDINGGNTYYEILNIDDNGKPDYFSKVSLNLSEEGIKKTTDINGKKITALQGQTRYEEISSDYIDGPFFDLDTDVASNSIRIYGQDGKEHKQLDSFMDTQLKYTTVPVYILERNDDNKIRIRYPSEKIVTYTGKKINEALFKKGETATVIYRTTNGELGNIKPGFINNNVVVKDSSGKNVTVLIKNEEHGYGGKNKEDLSSAVLNKPKSLRTLNRCVTAEDFDYLLNNNELILKSKTYSSSNQPEGFKKYYGRNISPHEAFIFAIMNKNYSNIKSVDYNTYPWITLNREPIINGKYVFGSSELNSELRYNIFGDYVTGGSTIYNTSLSKTNSTFKDIGENVMFKIHKTSQDEKYIKNIKSDWIASSIFDEDIKNENILSNLLDKNNEQASTDILSYENNILLNENVSAICTLKEQNEGPIDILNYKNKTTIKIDGIINREIDLFIDAHEDIENYKHYYVYLNNETNNTNIPVNIDKNSTEAARYRNGIKQIINNQIVSYVKNNSEEIFKLIDGEHEYTTICTNSSKASAINNTDEDYLFKLGEDIYLFKLGANILQSAKEYFKSGIYYKAFEKECLSQEIEYYKLINNVYEKQDVKKGTELNGEYYKKASLNETEDDELYKLYLQLIYNLHNVGSVVKKLNNDDFDTFEGNLLDYWFSIIEIEDDNEKLKKLVFSNSTPSDNIEKISKINNLEENYEYDCLLSNLIEEDLKQVKINYNEVAKIGKINEVEKMVLCSPMVGKESTIKLIKESTGLNIFDNFFGVRFENNETVKTKGQKKIKLLTEADNLTGGEIGDLLLTSNDASCLYFDNIYISFKSSMSEGLQILGNKIYNSNDLERVVAIEGFALSEQNTIDINKSNFDIRITKDLENTNSLYSISKNKAFEQLNIIENKRVNIETMEIKQGSIDNINNITPFKFSFGIDIENEEKDEDFITLGIDSFDSSEIFNKFEKYCYENSKVNLLSCLQKPVYNKNKLIFTNFLKNNLGNICFKYNDDNLETTKNFYKNLFGTNLTNRDFYNLYPKEEMLKINSEEIVVYEEGKENEYWYSPSQNEILKFIFRDFYFDEEGNKKSRFGDYYFEVTGNSFTNYDFYIHKTDFSNFPDCEFYLHFINDKRMIIDTLDTDEKKIQNFFVNKKILGTEINVLKPYFKTFDIKAEITYSVNYAKAVIEEKVKSLLNSEYSLNNAINIGVANKISKSKIIKLLMNIPGVTDVNIEYFGYDYDNRNNNPTQEVLIGDFYELICLANDEKNKHGKILTYSIDS